MLQTVDADAVRAGTLAVGFLHVYPAVVVCLVEELRVTCAERGETLLDYFERFLIVDLYLSVLYN